MKVKLKNLLDNINIFVLIFVLGLVPIVKYFEYVYNGPRINASLINSLIIITLISLFLFKLSRNGLKILPKGYRLEFKIFTFLLIAILLIVTIQPLLTLPHTLTFSNFFDFFRYYSGSIINYWLYFFIGWYILLLKKNKKINQILLFCWILYSSMVFFQSITNPTGFILTLNGEKTLYLMLADQYALLSLIVFSNLKRDITRLIFFLAASIILYALLSRSSMYFYVITTIVFFLKYNKYVLGGIIITLFSILLSLQSLGIKVTSQNENATNRMFRLFIGGTDSSKDSRTVLFNNGLRGLKDNWLTGEFLGDARKGVTGTFIHNYLSFWRQFGFFPFIFLSVIIFILYLKISLNFFMKGVPEINTSLAFLWLIGTFIILQIVFSRSYLNGQIWMFITSAIMYLYGDRSLNNKK